MFVEEFPHLSQTLKILFNFKFSLEQKARIGLSYLLPLLLNVSTVFFKKMFHVYVSKLITFFLSKVFLIFKMEDRLNLNNFKWNKYCRANRWPYTRNVE